MGGVILMQLNPPTPLFPVETKDKDLELFTKNIQKKISEQMGKVPSEELPNRLSVSSPTDQASNFFNNVPHNYRLYFDFKHDNFIPKGLYKTELHNCGGFSSVLGFLQDYNLTNHKSTHIFKFDNATIWIRKSSITICNKIDHKKAYAIPITINADKIIKEIIINKDQECKDLLSDFIKRYGGVSDFNIMNRHSEDGVYNDVAIDSIGSKDKFTNEVGKKVYGKNYFEFKNSVLASNYIVNHAIKSIAPELAAEFQINRDIMRGIIDIHRSTSLVLKDLVTHLSNGEVKEDSGMKEQKTLPDYIG